jgi:hypothetical protein
VRVHSNSQNGAMRTRRGILAVMKRKLSAGSPLRKLRALGQQAAERLPLHSIAIRGRPFLFGGRDRGGVVAQVINELRHGHKIDYAGDGHR